MVRKGVAEDAVQHFQFPFEDRDAAGGFLRFPEVPQHEFIRSTAARQRMAPAADRAESGLVNIFRRHRRVQVLIRQAVARGDGGAVQAELADQVVAAEVVGDVIQVAVAEAQELFRAEIVGPAIHLMDDRVGFAAVHRDEFAVRPAVANLHGFLIEREVFAVVDRVAGLGEVVHDTDSVLFPVAVHVQFVAVRGADQPAAGDVFGERQIRSEAGLH